MNTLIHHQNMMLALRQQMGWPPFKPANDCIGFTSGRTMDVETGMELGRIATMLAKDVIYAGWADVRAKTPSGFSIAYRELLTIDLIDRVLPYAANDDAPVVLVSVRHDEHFAIDRRGTLVRVTGKPKSLAAGRRLAMKRIKAAAAAMGDELLAGNRHVPWGADKIAPDAPGETVVRFG